MESKTSFIMPFTVEYDLERGIMKNPGRVLVRRASDMKDHFADSVALDRMIAAGDPVHYEVAETPVPEEYGHILYCVSTLHPGKVGDEYYMTKGHYHVVEETGELYLCLRGEGLMLMKTADGKFDYQPMRRGLMVYVPPYWAHRSVNTGTEPLVSFCSYNAEAGHNYGDIEKQGFIKRVFDRNGRVSVE